jgi:hypothetical protein
MPERLFYGSRPRQESQSIQIAADPPSTNNSMPATKLESSEARNNAALVISSDVPMRPSGKALNSAEIALQSTNLSECSPVFQSVVPICL